MTKILSEFLDTKDCRMVFFLAHLKRNTFFYYYFFSCSDFEKNYSRLGRKKYHTDFSYYQRWQFRTLHEFHHTIVHFTLSEGKYKVVTTYHGNAWIMYLNQRKVKLQGKSTVWSLRENSNTSNFPLDSPRFAYPIYLPLYRYF